MPRRDEGRVSSGDVVVSVKRAVSVFSSAFDLMTALVEFVEARSSMLPAARAQCCAGEHRRRSGGNHAPDAHAAVPRCVHGA